MDLPVLETMTGYRDGVLCRNLSTAVWTFQLPVKTMRL